MKKREASQHGAVEAWMRHFLKTHNGCKVELKHARGRKSFPLSEFEEHQLPELQAFADGAPFVYKFPDTGFGKKPCDLIGVRGGYSFVAIRYDDFMAILSIEVLIAEGRRAKSISGDRARKLAYDVIEF